MAFGSSTTLCHDEGSDRGRGTVSRPLSDSESSYDDDTSLVSLPCSSSETGVGSLTLTALCSAEGGDCDGEVVSRSLSDSEFEDTSRVWFPYSRSDTGVVCLGLTTLCGDDGGDRKANNACNCALACVSSLYSNSKSDSYTISTLRACARCRDDSERLRGDPGS